MAVEKKKRVYKRKKKTVEKKVVEPVKKKTSFLEERHRVPNLSMYPTITVYACSCGYGKYRFNTDLTKLNKALVWKKEMSGLEATQFLRGVKARNREGKLESTNLPT